MKIVYLTAGAAGMYCGSCMRDNTLTAALRAMGRNIKLVPLYTPIRTDEPDVSEQCIFYGAINIYMQQRFPLFRHTPWWIDRVFDSPTILRRVARLSGGESYRDLGELTISMLQGEHGPQGKEAMKLIRWLKKVRPDLVNLPNAMFVHLARPIKRELGIPVLCTLTGEDIFIDKLPEPFSRRVIDMIRDQGRDVDGFVATSEYYASHCCQRFSIPRNRMHVIRPGIRIDSPDRVSQSPAEPFTIGYLARICPEKGLHILCEAAGILHREGRLFRLCVAGYLADSDRPYLDTVRKRVIEQGFNNTFEYLGELDRAGKQAMLRSLHILSVPTVYREPKGLFILEALAHGVPVVQPCHGAFPELVEATGGGLLVDPDNPRALAEDIARLMDDPGLRQRLGCQGQQSVFESFTDKVMAEQTWSLYQSFCCEANNARNM
ncbi:MAG: glycosyltransferase family 4 protein [Planctomycetota bacterium]|nr:MAG: glycosyltransferase family 4 protein [Planctomycetota bacterium]